MSPLDKQVLHHVVVDADAWYAHALKTFGEERANAMLAAKVERWYQSYMQESAKPDYKTRAERESELTVAKEDLCHSNSKNILSG